MDNEKEKTYISILEEAQESMSDIVLPSMGIIDNETKVEIDANDYIKNKKSKEE